MELLENLWNLIVSPEYWPFILGMLKRAHGIWRWIQRRPVASEEGPIVLVLVVFAGAADTGTGPSGSSPATRSAGTRTRHHAQAIADSRGGLLAG